MCARRRSSSSSSAAGRDTVVHLAAIVTPGKHGNREFEYSVDVPGTENVLKACLAAGVRKIIVSSSGAAYGYHPDNPAWITEDQPIRGNQAFAYAWHKRLVEEMLARWRIEHPELKQVVFRIGTILGATVHNQITDLFEKPRPIAIRGADSPFVFIWDQDVVGCILHALGDRATGIFNVAGDGALTIHEIAAASGQAMRVLPAWVFARRAGGAEGLGSHPVRAGATGLPALPSGAGQQEAEGGVRLCPAQDLGGGVRVLACGPPVRAATRCRRPMQRPADPGRRDRR